MRFSTNQYDNIVRRLRVENANMLVPYFLMASHAYYDLNDPFLSDQCYDWLCNELDNEWDKIEHWHKHIIDRDALRAGTAYQLQGKMPQRIIHATRHLCYKYNSVDEVGKVAPAPCEIDDLLGTPTDIEDLL